MRKPFFIILGAFLSPLSSWAAPSAPITEVPPLIPTPKESNIRTHTPGFLIGNSLTFDTPKDKCLTETLRALKEILHKNTQIPVHIATKKGTDRVIFSLINHPDLGNEGYLLTVSPKSITIKANTPAGIFNGGTTLAQLITKDSNNNFAIPITSISDSPRFSWRGLMIDSCRHAYPVEDMMTIIDTMARYKFNTLHWHLTDDQGWRVEIKKYPLLNSVGGTRNSRAIMGQRTKKIDKPYSFFYTQEDIKKLVTYAHARGITIIPEIELPGHAAAAITAYPELGNTDIPAYKPEVLWQWGVHPYTFSPKEKTFSFIDDVMTELVALFPHSPFIHVGGDEAPKTQWQQSPTAQKIMKEQHLNNEHELQAYFIKRVEQILLKKGKKLIGWDEINEGGLSSTAAMMVWRDWKWAKFAAKNGNKMVMTPTSHCYLDYGQGITPKTPAFDHIGGNIPLEKVYNLNPVPPDFTAEEEALVLGVQGNCWSEYMPTLAKWQYMVFLRAIALSEVAWSPQASKNWDSFNQRLSKQLPVLDMLKINYRKEDGSPAQASAKLLLE